MELSTTSKYAIKILATMSENSTIRYSVKDLSNQLDIPYKYLSKVMTKLSKNHLIVSSKGKNGGFMIAKNLHDITILDIVKIFDGDFTQKCILEERKCGHHKKCILHDNWQVSKHEINKFYKNTSLFDLVKPS